MGYFALSAQQTFFCLSGEVARTVLFKPLLLPSPSSVALLDDEDSIAAGGGRGGGSPTLVEESGEDAIDVVVTSAAACADVALVLDDDVPLSSSAFPATLFFLPLLPAAAFSSSFPIPCSSCRPSSSERGRSGGPPPMAIDLATTCQITYMHVHAYKR